MDPLNKDQETGAAPETESGANDKAGEGESALLAAITKLTDTIGQVSARQERTDKVLALTADERAVFDQLSKEAQDSFLDANATDRGVLAAQANKAAAEATLSGQPAYKSASGLELPAGTDPVIVALVQKMDQQNDAMTEMAKSLRQQDLESRAKDAFSFIGGTPVAKAALMGLVDDLKTDNPEVGKQVEEMLKGANAGVEYALTAQGTDALSGLGTGGGADIMKQAAEAQLVAQGTLSEPLMELRKMADDYHMKNPDISRAKAYQLMSSTPRGRELAASHYQTMPVDLV